MKNRTKKVDYTSNKMPQSLWHAFFLLLWPLNAWWKKVIFVIVIVFVASFAIWAALPERTKTETVDYFKGSRKAQSPPVVTPGKGSNIQNEYPDASKKTAKPVPQSPVKRRTQGLSQEGIRQQTEGDQSPAVISGGDVNISIEGKQK